MSTQKIFNNVKFSRNKLKLSSSHLRLLTSSVVLRNSEKINEENAKDERKLKTWHPPLVEFKKPLIDIGISYNTFNFLRGKPIVSPSGLKKYWKAKVAEADKEQQKFIPERFEILGSNLSAAYFIVYRLGKVKFNNTDKWISLNEKFENVDLPSVFNPNYVLTEIDASGITIFYEGLENLEGLTRLKRLIFAKSPLFNDWYLDKISTLFPNLEYLDISDCPRMSERGLETIHRITSLKTLIVTDYDKTSKFALTCMLLEDINPALEIDIRTPTRDRPERIN